jgi:hypothetical protein
MIHHEVLRVPNIARRQADRYDSYRNLYGLVTMKTTLDIDDALLAKAKSLSAREKKSLTCLIEEGLRLRLRQRKQDPQRAKPRRRKLPTYKGRGGVAPGVDPTSNRAMFEAAGDE